MSEAGQIAWKTIGVLSLVCAIALAVVVHMQHITQADIATYAFINHHAITYSTIPFVRAVTQLASAVVLILLAAMILLVVPNRKIGIAVIINLASIAAINEVIKYIMARPRPRVPHLVVEHGYSFPSGHAMASTAFYGFLIFLVFRYVNNRTARWVSIVILALIPPTIMFSRVFLGVHYMTDVCAGCFFSIAYLTLFYIPIMKRTLLKPQPLNQSINQSLNVN